MLIGRAAHYISGPACFSLKVPADYGAFYRLIKRHVILAYTRASQPVSYDREWILPVYVVPRMAALPRS